MRSRSGSAGFTFLELVLVVALIGTMIAVAISKLVPYAAEAERVAVLRIEGQLRNVLVMEAALLIARGDSGRLIHMDRANPMAFLLEPPGTYLGELNAPTHALLPARSWHFDTRTRRLVYRAGRGFVRPADGPAMHEYDVRLAFEDRDGDERFSPGVDEFHGVRLHRLEMPVPGA